MSNHNIPSSLGDDDVPADYRNYSLWEALSDRFGPHENLESLIATLETSEDSAEREIAKALYTFERLTEDMSLLKNTLDRAIVSMIFPKTYLQHEVSNLTDLPPIDEVESRLENLRAQIKAISIDLS